MTRHHENEQRLADLLDDIELLHHEFTPEALRLIAGQMLTHPGMRVALAETTP